MFPLHPPLMNLEARKGAISSSLNNSVYRFVCACKNVLTKTKRNEQLVLYKDN